MTDHEKYEKRQLEYENKYKRDYYAYLQDVSIGVSEAIKKEGSGINLHDYLQEERLKSIFTELYMEVSLNEAVLQYNQLEGVREKDGLMDLVGILSGQGGSLINLWRSLLGEFIQVRILQRITMVNQTTVEHLAKIIQQRMSEGWGKERIAKVIANEQPYNRNRSLAISRTETTRAANQGRYMAAQSSDLVQEKAWLPVIDSRTRLPHRQMDPERYIPLDQAFHIANNRGWLESGQYPCDDSFSASNVVNCRCVLTFKAKRDENGNLIFK